MLMNATHGRCAPYRSRTMRCPVTFVQKHPLIPVVVAHAAGCHLPYAIARLDRNLLFRLVEKRCELPLVDFGIQVGLVFEHGAEALVVPEQPAFHVDETQKQRAVFSKGPCDFVAVPGQPLLEGVDVLQRVALRVPPVVDLDCERYKQAQQTRRPAEPQHAGRRKQHHDHVDLDVGVDDFVQKFIGHVSSFAQILQYTTNHTRQNKKPEPGSGLCASISLRRTAGAPRCAPV